MEAAPSVEDSVRPDTAVESVKLETAVDSMIPKTAVESVDPEVAVDSMTLAPSVTVDTGLRDIVNGDDEDLENGGSLLERIQARMRAQGNAQAAALVASMRADMMPNDNQHEDMSSNDSQHQRDTTEHDSKAVASVQSKDQDMPPTTATVHQPSRGMTSLVADIENRVDGPITSIASSESQLASTSSKPSSSKTGRPKPRSESSDTAIPLYRTTSGTTNTTTLFRTCILDELPTVSLRMREQNRHEFQAITLYPSEFRVVLLVDSHESNKFRSVIDAIDVEFEQRLMNVGDYAWVARHNGGVHPDLMLDCIIERKRTDDLISSIKNARLAEQKSRLMTCGVGKRMVLIEEKHGYTDTETLKKAREQSIVNMQAHERFIVHRTSDAKSTGRYLNRLTRYLKRQYEGKSLRSCPVELWPTLRNDELSTTQQHFCPTFAEFNEAAVKTQPLTVRDCMVRQLMCIPRLGCNDATIISQMYPTWRCLFDAFDRCDSDEEKLKLLTMNPVTGAKSGIGSTLSVRVANFMSVKLD